MYYIFKKKEADAGKGGCGRGVRGTKTMSIDITKVLWKKKTKGFAKRTTG